MKSNHDNIVATCGYSLEQPWGSTMWKDDNETPLRLDQIPDHRAKQRVDQCMHDLKDERGYFIQKSTGLGANIKFNKTALRCSGHPGQGHSHLQGVAPNGLLRTAMAAVYPKRSGRKLLTRILRADPPREPDQQGAHTTSRRSSWSWGSIW